VSLWRSKQFAIVQGATQSRVDLSLNLKGAEATERLGSRKVFGGMCTHVPGLTIAGEVDAEVGG
jgi:hypothetical protein